MDEALHDVLLYCEFAHFDPFATRLLDESTVLRIRHLLKAYGLSMRIIVAINAALAQKWLLPKTGAAVEATLIAALSRTKKNSGERGPEMHQTKKGRQW